MKGIFWTESGITILENSEKEKDRYGRLFGDSTIELDDVHLEALKAGKMLAFNDSEYSTFLIYKPKERANDE